MGPVIGPVLGLEIRKAGGSNLFVSFFLFRLLRGTHTPSFAHSAPMRAEDFFVHTEGMRTEGPRGGPCSVSFLVSFL
jgi:hypothetical protein